MEKSQEGKLEFDLFEGWVLLTTEPAGALVSGQNFTHPSHDQEMCVFMTQDPAASSAHRALHRIQGSAHRTRPQTLERDIKISLCVAT